MREKTEPQGKHCSMPAVMVSGHMFVSIIAVT